MKTIITIGREVGSGGYEIGKQLAQKLNIAFYNDEIITIASQESGIDAEFFKKEDEKRSSIFSKFFGNFASIESPISDSILDPHSLFNIQSNVIKNAAKESNAIFVGRCADYILRKEAKLISVFIYANDEFKTKRYRTYNQVEDIDQMSDDKVLALLKKADKNRKEYYEYFTCQEWGGTKSYNLCLDSSKLGIETCVNILEKLFLDMSN